MRSPNDEWCFVIRHSVFVIPNLGHWSLGFGNFIERLDTKTDSLPGVFVPGDI
jgi:hypothetical protein